MPQAHAHAPSRSHEQVAIEQFRADPEYAAEYLSAILEDGDQQEVMIALRRITQAFGGVSKLAEQTELNATTLYRTLSPQGNPEMKTLTTMLKALGLRLAVMPITTHSHA
jgi:probable addiction module antidote protein